MKAAADRARAKEVEEFTEELKAKVKELEEFRDLAVGRELKMKQMEAELERELEEVRV